LGIHVWYVNYGDYADQLTITSASIQDLKQRIQAEDPNAVIDEIRVYPLTAGIKVNHTTWTTTKLADGTVLVYDKERLIGPIGLIVLAILALTAIWVVYWAAQPTVMQARLAYIVETTQHTCPGDPSRPGEECGMHTDADGNPLVFTGKDAFRAHLAAAHPTALTYLVDTNLVNRDLGSGTAWYEQIFNWLPVILILIGAAIFIPIITKLIPSKEGA